VHPNGKTALGLHYVRLAKCRRVVGCDSPFSYPDFAPQDDGLLEIDLNSGKSRLLLSIYDAVKAAGMPLPADNYWWFNHLSYNPSGSEFVFLLRKRCDENGIGFLDSFWTMHANGSGLRCLLPLGTRVSHFTWVNDVQLIVSTDHGMPGHIRFIRLGLQGSAWDEFAPGLITQDGHASFRPQGGWLVCDAYPDAKSGKIPLRLLHLPTQTLHSLGDYAAPAPYRGDIRCDLHPRWRADGQCITIDSVHEGTRQVYMIELVL